MKNKLAVAARCLAVVATLAWFAFLAVHATSAQDRPAAPTPREWPMTSLERETLEDVAAMDASLAPVCSGNPQAAEIVHRAYRLGQKDATLRSDAERRLGCAVVSAVTSSGLVWVERRR